MGRHWRKISLYQFVWKDCYPTVILLMCSKSPLFKQPVYWWTEEIAWIRRAYLRARRTGSRSIIPADTFHKSEPKWLQESISAEKSIRERLKETLAQKVWGNLGRISIPILGTWVTKLFLKLSAWTPPSVMKGATKEKVVIALFPKHSLCLRVDFEKVEDIPFCSTEDLETSVLSLKRN